MLIIVLLVQVQTAWAENINSFNEFVRYIFCELGNCLFSTLIDTFNYCITRYSDTLYIFCTNIYLFSHIDASMFSTLFALAVLFFILLECNAGCKAHKLYTNISFCKYKKRFLFEFHCIFVLLLASRALLRTQTESGILCHCWFSYGPWLHNH